MSIVVLLPLVAPALIVMFPFGASCGRRNSRGKVLPHHGSGVGGSIGGGSGTPAGNYTVTVNACTVSSTDASVPSASTTFNLTVK